MEDGVELIVEQVVNPKIKSVIEPEVCYVDCMIMIIFYKRNYMYMFKGNPAFRSREYELMLFSCLYR